MKKLSVIGNSLGVIIDKPILELLRIDRTTELEVHTDGKRLIIEPSKASKSIDKVFTRYAKVMKNLAKK